MHHLGAGYVAGAMMVLATNPVWMIKTRMQLQDKNAKAGGVRPYSGLAGVAGWRAWQGVSALPALEILARSPSTRSLSPSMLLVPAVRRSSDGKRVGVLFPLPCLPKFIVSIFVGSKEWSQQTQRRRVTHG